MAKVTRRTFLQGASAGAAAVGALAAGSHLVGQETKTKTMAASRSAGAPATGSAAMASSEPVVAYVRDRAKGEVALFIGTREIIRRDPDLVARLLEGSA